MHLENVGNSLAVRGNSVTAQLGILSSLVGRRTPLAPKWLYQRVCEEVQYDYSAVEPRLGCLPRIRSRQQAQLILDSLARPMMFWTAITIWRLVLVWLAQRISFPWEGFQSLVTLRGFAARWDREFLFSKLAFQGIRTSDAWPRWAGTVCPLSPPVRALLASEPRPVALLRMPECVDHSTVCHGPFRVVLMPREGASGGPPGAGCSVITIGPRLLYNHGNTRRGPGAGPLVRRST
jgi:hypothetical protein